MWLCELICTAIYRQIIHWFSIRTDRLQNILLHLLNFYYDQISTGTCGTAALFNFKTNHLFRQSICKVPQEPERVQREAAFLLPSAPGKNAIVCLTPVSHRKVIHRFSSFFKWIYQYFVICGVGFSTLCGRWKFTNL